MSKEPQSLEDFEREMPVKIGLQALLDALLDNERAFPVRYLHRFSDLPPEETQAVREIWPRVSLTRRRALMEDLQSLAEDDSLLSFEGMGRLALEDADPKVRFGGLQTLIASECRAPDLVHIFVGLLENDPDEHVQALAAVALGPFVYAAEVDKLSPTLAGYLEEHLLAAMKTHISPEVRRRVLESLGYSSNPEVPTFIEQAIQENDVQWQASALYAMGRSADEVWEPHVVEKLRHPNPLLRAEAARSAGELELKSARRILLELVNDADSDVRDAALWSLSQIGGQGVRRVLQERLDAAEDDDESRFLEDALDNLTFTEGGDVFNLLDISPEDLAQLRELLDDE
ncbi:MAG: hypothetical protein D6755_10125 [Anaerolineae bacterium]|nr:MAG: hypothetical protein D6755_10125 [Anaerolineae bacterium]